MKIHNVSSLNEPYNFKELCMNNADPERFCNLNSQDDNYPTLMVVLTILIVQDPPDPKVKTRQYASEPSSNLLEQLDQNFSLVLNPDNPNRDTFMCTYNPK